MESTNVLLLGVKARLSQFENSTSGKRRMDPRQQRSDTFYDSPPKNQPKSVTKKIVMQRLIFGSRLHDAPHMGDMD